MGSISSFLSIFAGSTTSVAGNQQQTTSDTTFGQLLASINDTPQNSATTTSASTTGSNGIVSALLQDIEQLFTQMSDDIQSVASGITTAQNASCTPNTISSNCNTHDSDQVRENHHHYHGSESVPLTPNAELGAGPGSVEADLLCQGKSWCPTNAPIATGGYVEDILNGRLNQPQGRGDIGVVTSVGVGANGRSYATVNFGRGYSVNIYTTELSSVNIEPANQPFQRG